MVIELDFTSHLGFVALSIKSQACLFCLARISSSSFLIVDFLNKLIRSHSKYVYQIVDLQCKEYQYKPFRCQNNPIKFKQSPFDLKFTTFIQTHILTVL